MKLVFYEIMKDVYLFYIIKIKLSVILSFISLFEIK